MKCPDCKKKLKKDYVVTHYWCDECGEIDKTTTRRVMQ